MCYWLLIIIMITYLLIASYVGIYGGRYGKQRHNVPNFRARPIVRRSYQTSQMVATT